MLTCSLPLCLYLSISLCRSPSLSLSFPTLLVFKILWFVSLQTLMSSRGKIRAGITSKHQHRLPSSFQIPPSSCSFFSPPSSDFISSLYVLLSHCLISLRLSHIVLLFSQFPLCFPSLTSSPLLRPVSVAFPFFYISPLLFAFIFPFVTRFFFWISVSLLTAKYCIGTNTKQHFTLNHFGKTGVLLLSMGSFQDSLSLSLCCLSNCLSLQFSWYFWSKNRTSNLQNRLV